MSDNAASGDTRSNLSPDQIRFLSSPIWGPALRQDTDKDKDNNRKAAKGNVYIPGHFVISQLNTAFCFDGWSHEIVALDRVHIEKTGDGKIKALYTCHVRLTVRCQDGTTFSHDGIGSDEKTGSNMKDVIAQVTKTAHTDAIKNAAIHIGRQFGLDTVRAGTNFDGQKVNWRYNASADPPRPPMFAGVSLALSEVFDEDGGEAVGGNGGVADPPAREYTLMDAREEVGAGAFAVPPPATPTSTPRTPPAPPPHQQPTQQPSQQPSHQPTQQPTPASPPSDGFDRAATIVACRQGFRNVGEVAGNQIFSGIARRFGFSGPLLMLGKPANMGGPSDEMLAAFLAELNAAQVSR